MATEVEEARPLLEQLGGQMHSLNNSINEYIKSNPTVLEIPEGNDDEGAVSDVLGKKVRDYMLIAHALNSMIKGGYLK